MKKMTVFQEKTDCNNEMPRLTEESQALLESAQASQTTTAPLLVTEGKKEMLIAEMYVANYFKSFGCCICRPNLSLTSLVFAELLPMICIQSRPATVADYKQLWGRRAKQATDGEQ